MNKLHDQIVETREAVEQMLSDNHQKKPGSGYDYVIGHELTELVDAIGTIRSMLLECYQCTEAQETRAHKQLERAVKQAYKASAELDKLHKAIVKATGGMNPAAFVRNNSVQ